MRTYGLLQAIMLQQDAAESIAVAILNNEEFNWKALYPDAHAVRSIRNDVAGHPTYRNARESIYLVQMSLHKWYFSYHINSARDGLNTRFVDVDVKKVIKATTKCVNDILHQTLDFLVRELKDWKDMHKQRKMADVFNGLEYAFEKVLLDDIVFKDAGYKHTKQMVQACKEEVILRYGSEHIIDAFKYLFKEIDALYKQIDSGLTGLGTCACHYCTA